MVKLKPFRALRYDVEKGIDLSKNISLPYDKISQEQFEYYCQNSQSNIVHSLLNAQKKSDYSHSLKLIQSWIKDSILMKDLSENFYIYEQEFFDRFSQKKKRTALVAMVFMDDSKILPHEKTLDHPKKDRMELMKKTGINFGQIFTLFQDKKKEILPFMNQAKNKKKALFDIFTEIEKVRHRVWVIDEKKEIQKIQNFFEDKVLYIADGHHRYETAKAYSDAMASKNPATKKLLNYRLMSLVDSQDEGLLILPTHRVLKNLKNFDQKIFLKNLAHFFDIEILKKEENDKNRLQKFFKDKNSYSFFLKLSSNENDYICTLKKECCLQDILNEKFNALHRCFVFILNELVFKQALSITEENIAKESYLTYERSAQKAIQMVDNKEAQGAFILKAEAVENIMNVANKSLFMPQKSTDFFPKMYSGILMSQLLDC